MKYKCDVKICDRKKQKNKTYTQTKIKYYISPTLDQIAVGYSKPGWKKKTLVVGCILSSCTFISKNYSK